MTKIIEAIRARLIADWRLFFRFWSVRLNGLGLLLLTGCQIATDAWNSMPTDLRHAMPYAQGISIALLVGGLIARLFVQPKLEDQRNAGQ